jgi:hypothetical protein
MRKPESIFFADKVTVLPKFGDSLPEFGEVQNGWKWRVFRS